MLSYTRTLDQEIAPPVTFALDATPLSVPNGGVARYTLELARALALRFPGDLYWLLSDQYIPPHSLPPQADLPPNLRIGGNPTNPLSRKWWMFGLPREMARVGADLFHGTDFSVPYLPVKPSVMTLHDLSPWMEPSWQPGAGRVRKRTPRLLRLGLASMVITPTQAIRTAAIERFSLAPDRVVAVPLAAGEHFRPVKTAPGERPYFLFVGTLEPRKNITRVLEAWREVRKTLDVDLVLAGRVRKDFAAPEPQPGLRITGAVPESEMPALYSGAVACLYPSLYEGFGLPVLESMRCGTLVITSRDPAIQEVAGDAAVTVEATDVKALVQAMRSALTNPEGFAGLRMKGLRRAREFTWQRTAELTREVYGAAIRSFQ